MMLDKMTNLLLKELYARDKMTIQEIEHITGTDEMKSTSLNFNYFQRRVLSSHGKIRM